MNDDYVLLTIVLGTFLFFSVMANVAMSGKSGKYELCENMLIKNGIINDMNNTKE